MQILIVYDPDGTPSNKREHRPPLVFGAGAGASRYVDMPKVFTIIFGRLPISIGKQFVWILNWCKASLGFFCEEGYVLCFFMVGV